MIALLFVMVSLALTSNVIAFNGSLLILSAPRKEVHENSVFEAIVDFQIQFAKNIKKGNDSVLILTDGDSHSLYEEELSHDILIKNMEQDSIWMRDFTTVDSNNPIQFKYSSPKTNETDPDSQETFNKKILNNIRPSKSWKLHKSNLILDGGNFVDNNEKRVIVSNKVLESAGLNPQNQTSRRLMKDKIKNLTNFTEVAIIPYDTDFESSDRIVMWINNNTIVVNNIKEKPELRTAVLNELKTSFPNVTIIEVPDEYAETSSVGININSVVTDQFIYVPVFGNSTDDNFISILSKHTNKTIVPIDATDITRVGGSCRSLTWQTSGKFAESVLQFLNPGKGSKSTKNEFEKIVIIVSAAGSLMAAVGVFGICLSIKKRRARNYLPIETPDTAFVPVRGPGDAPDGAPVKTFY